MRRCSEYVQDDLPLQKGGNSRQKDFLKIKMPDFNSNRRLADKIYGPTLKEPKW